MERKIIQQSATSVGISLPFKWVKKQGLKAGDSIDVSEKDADLMLSPKMGKKEKKEIKLEIKDLRESVVRTLLVNSYRAGFDKIYLEYNGKIDILNQIVKEHLLGFEVFHKEGKHFIVESVAEPSYDNFENIIEKQFFILLEIMRKTGTEDVKQDVFRVQKYDNFLKRCLAKNLFNHEATPFLWQFLSNLVQISRQCYHLSKIILGEKIKLKNFEIEYLKQCEEMFVLLQKGYLKKDLAPLTELHEREQVLVYEKGPDLLKKDALVMHYLIYLARLIYLANSPLTGVLQTQMMS